VRACGVGGWSFVQARVWQSNIKKPGQNVAYCTACDAEPIHGVAKHAGGGSTKNQKKQKEASQVNTIAKERTVILGCWGSRAAEG